MEQPTSVQGWCISRGAFCGLLLPCTFCFKFLSNIEKLRFDKTPLNLIWKEGCVYGCCQTCIRNCSAVEQAVHFQQHIKTEKFYKLAEAWCGPYPRCALCYTHLTRDEFFVSGFSSTIYQVRGVLRGLCGLCRLSVD
uniref:Protein E6 n=1 Tax=Enhydra lutris kenyoni papillomavirus 2 TaxID=3073258 RepID=A0AA51X1Y9_9PAPI|nr:E6 [Enhydra lutris kenyoni papillomavirus 2]